MSRYKYALVACARWEETDIVEWIEYHRSIGFDHIYIYSNDDDPETLRLVLLPYLLGPLPYVTYRHFPYIGRQADIYLHFLDAYTHEVDWFSFLDIDEFVTLPGLNDIGRFIAAFEKDWDCIYLNWLLFGHNGHQKREAGSVLSRFTRRAGTIDPHTKNLVRASAVKTADIRSRFAAAPQGFWHFWDGLRIPGLRICNVLGEPAERYAEDWPRNAEAFAQRLGITEAVLSRGYVSHYIFKSEEDFLRREARGSIGSFAAQADWARMYREGGHRAVLDRLNAVPDRLLAEYWETWLRRIEPIRIVPAPEGPNIALRKPARQSSVWGALEASGGNNGLKTGKAAFHTELEAEPWWEVDLLARYAITEIRLFNRIDDPGCAARAERLVVEIRQQDGTEWEIIHKQERPFGGIDGNLLRLRFQPPTRGRHVRVRLLATEFLHLDEVEVFGNVIGDD